ncbi:Ig-like domain repeat protein [Methanobrevibacter sp.]
MKIKNIFLLSLILLAILIIGAVSASEDISDDTSVVSVSDDAISEDSLTVSDEGADIEEAPVVDSLSANEGDDSIQSVDDEIILGEGDGGDGLDDDPYYTIFNGDEIITDSGDEEYDEDAFIAAIILPPETSEGRFNALVNGEVLFNGDISDDESDWHLDDEGNLICNIYLKDLDLEYIYDGAEVEFSFWVDDEKIDRYTLVVKAEVTDSTIRFYEEGGEDYGFNPEILDQLNINDEDTVVQINAHFEGTLEVTVYDEAREEEWTIYHEVNDDDFDREYVRLNLEDLGITQTGVYFLSGKFIYSPEEEEELFTNHRLRVISDFYTNEGLITYKEVVGLITDDRNLNTGRIVIMDIADDTVYFDKSLADMEYNDHMMGYIYNQYHGYYVFAEDLVNIDNGIYDIRAIYYDDNGDVIETSDSTIYLDLVSSINTDEIDFHDNEAVLIKVYIFEMYEDSYIVFGDWIETDDDDKYVTYFKSEKITASDVGNVLTFTLEDLGFDEGFYFGDLTIVGEDSEEDWAYNYKIAFDKEIKIVDNSKFRIKMDEDVSLFDEDEIFFVYCPEDYADTTITITVEDEDHNLVHSFDYPISAEDAGAYVGFTLNELNVINPGEYFFCVLEGEEELVEPLGFEFGNPLEPRDVCIVDDEEASTLVEFFVPEGLSEGSLIITDEDGNELFNKPLTEIEYYSEGYEEGFIRYFVKYEDLNTELEINEIYKLTASYVGSKNFEVEWEVSIFEKTIAEKNGVSIELFDHWTHDLSDDWDRFARVIAPDNEGSVDIFIDEWTRTFSLYWDEDAYCREFYIEDIDYHLSPGTYIVTVIYYDVIGEEILSLSAEMEFIFDNEDRSEIIIFIDEEINYPTTGDEIDDGFVAISVPAELEGSVVIRANDEDFFSKSLSDFEGNKVGPEDDEELEDYLRYVISPLDVNFFEGLDDGDVVEISVLDEDENILRYKTYLIFFEEDSFRLEGTDYDEEGSIVINEDEIITNPDSEDYDPNQIVATIYNDVYKVVIELLDSDEPLYEMVIDDEDWFDGKFYIHLSDIEEQLEQIKDKDVVVFTVYDDEGEVIDEPIACQVKVTDEFIQFFEGYEESPGMEFNVFYGNLTTGDLNDEELMGWHPEGRFIEIIYPEELDDFTVTFGDTTLSISDFVADYAYSLGGYSYTLMLEDIDLDLITENEYITFTLSALGETFTQKRIRLGEYVYKVATPGDVARLFDISIVDEILTDGSETAISFLATEDANPQSMVIDIGGGIFNVYVDDVKVENLGRILGFEGDELETFDVWDLREILNIQLSDLGITEAGTYNIKITHTPYDDEENEYMYIVETELMNKDVTWFAKINPNFVIAPIESVEEGNPISISISEDTGFVGYVTVSVGENTATIHIVDGATGTLSTDGLAPGEYTVDLVSEETATHNAGEASATFTITEKVVPKVDPELSVVGPTDDVEIGSSVVFTINAVEDFNGVVTVYRNNDVVGTSNLVNGQGTVAVDTSGFGVGPSTLVFESVDDDTYSAGHAEFTINVIDKQLIDPELSVVGPTDDVEIGSSVVFTITAVEDFNGVVKVYRNNDLIGEVTLVDGFGTITVDTSGFAVGPNMIVFNSDEDDTFAAGVAEFNLNVIDKQPIDPELTIVAEMTEIDFGNDATFFIRTNEAFSGIVTVLIDGNTYDVSVNEGVGQLTVPNLNAGTYTATAIFEATDEFNADTDEVIFVVSKATPSITVPLLDVDYPNPIPLKITVVGVDGASVPTGNVSIVIVLSDGTIIKDINPVSLDDGELNMPISGLGAGDYNLTITYIGDNNYNGASFNGSFKVNAIESGVTVEPISFDFGGSGTVTAVVDGATGITAFIDGFADAVVVDGLSITVSGLDAGDYNLKVTTIPDLNHIAKTISVPVTVNKVDATVEVSDISLTYGDSGVVTVVVDGATGITAFIDGFADAVVVDGLSITVSGLDAGTYTLSVNAVPDANHNVAIATATVTVNKANSTVEVSDIVFDYGSSGTATVVIDGAISVTATIDGDKGVVIVSGDVITVSGLDAGTYTLTVTTIPDENHNEKTISVPVTVNKINPNFVIAPIESVEEGNPITISISEDTGFVGDVTVSVGENTATIHIADGVGTGTLSTDGLAPGEQTVALVAAETVNHNAGEASAAFTITEKVVPKVDPALTISVEDIDFGSDAIVVIRTNETFSGTVMVQVEGNYTVEVINGEGQVTVSGLNAGTYTAKAIFEATDIFNEDEASIDFTVNKVDSSVSCDAITYDYSSSGTVTAVVDGATGITASIAGFANAVKVDGNKITVSGLDPGNYTLTVTTVPDANHNAKTITVPVTVTGVKKRIATKIIYNDMATAPVNTTKDGRIGNYFVVKLVDANGKALPGLPIKIGFNGNIYERNITSNGAASLQINLKKEGVYTFAIYFSGDKDYLGSFAVAKITVSKSNPKPNKANQSATGSPASVNKTGTKTKTAINYSDMVTTTVHSADGRIGKYFTFKLVDKSGKAIAGKPIQIGFNGNIYNRTTDANGMAKLQINLKKAAVYTFAISFLEDDKYQGSFAVAKITVNTQTPKLTAASKTFKASTKTKKISATFKTANGNVVKGMKITFTVNGKSYTATTNANGVATVSISLTKKGTYTAVAKFAGDTCFKATSKKFTVKIT